MSILSWALAAAVLIAAAAIAFSFGAAVASDMLRKHLRAELHVFTGGKWHLVEGGTWEERKARLRELTEAAGEARIEKEGESE